MPGLIPPPNSAAGQNLVSCMLSMCCTKLHPPLLTVLLVFACFHISPSCVSMVWEWAQASQRWVRVVSCIHFHSTSLIKGKLALGLWDGRVMVVMVAAAGRYRRRENSKLITASIIQQLKFLRAWRRMPKMWFYKMYLVKPNRSLHYHCVNLENKPVSKNKQDKQTSLPMTWSCAERWLWVLKGGK